MTDLLPGLPAPEPTVTDSAGHVRTISQVRKLAEDTADQMSPLALMEMLVDECGGVDRLPSVLTRCDCHGLWYDECETYR